jgi:glycosyltransferase involved in cell wall biosynthesis
MQERGFDVTLVASPGPDLDVVHERERVPVVAVPMLREPSPGHDVVSLAKVGAALARLRPDIVNASTPKAGLLGMIAARALRIPVRVYLLRGLRLETALGTLKRVLGATERIAAACAHEVVCNSESLRQLAVSGGWVPRRKAVVLGAGSSNGVDGARFEVSDAVRARAAKLAAGLGLDPRGETVGFVGRFSADKGLDLLLDAFERLRIKRPGARLLLVGGDLGDEEVPASLLTRVRAAKDIINIGRVDDVVAYYAMMRVLAFPSRREGFPNFPIEAACAEVPVVARRSTGVVDAIVDGVTGAVLHDPTPEAYAAALERYLGDPPLARAHGRAGRARALAEFAPNVVWARWTAEYERLLGQRGRG